MSFYIAKIFSHFYNYILKIFLTSRFDKTRRVHVAQLVSIRWLNKEGVLKLKKKVEP